jgi:hypothetical protein
MGEGRRMYEFLVKSSKERDHSEDLGVDRRMGTECCLGRLAAGFWSGFTWLIIGTRGGIL